MRQGYIYTFGERTGYNITASKDGETLRFKNVAYRDFKRLIREMKEDGYEDFKANKIKHSTKK